MSKEKQVSILLCKKKVQKKNRFSQLELYIAFTIRSSTLRPDDSDLIPSCSSSSELSTSLLGGSSFSDILSLFSVVGGSFFLVLVFEFCSLLALVSLFLFICKTERSLKDQWLDDSRFFKIEDSIKI